ncbi:plasmid pRiA4b ORF-3 family protein [Rhodococcus sp. ANT_H53B]|nr:plasmid pRiA4b ORF-3 family protein [Rhodococcus sp. ANT_H53B]
MKSSLEEWDDGTGTPEDGVRVDDVLGAVGDRLGYEYDFGDGWTHHLVVEEISTAAGTAACLDGGRACPPEDCGGSSGYDELLKVLADTDHPEHDHMKLWAGDFDERFAVADANDRIALRRAVTELASQVRDRLPKLGSLLERGPLEHHPDLPDVLARVDVDVAQVDPAVAASAMEKLTWMLARVGEDGITLTAAGYVPPKDVAAMRAELGWGTRWFGNSNREVDHQQVHWLRAAVTQLGLVRVLKGRLLRTRLGNTLATDPVRLWSHAAARMPVGREQYEKDAGVLLLVSVAASCSVDERNSLVFRSLEALGWMIPERERPYAQYLARPTLDFLTLIGAVPSTLGREGAGPDWGRQFAVHALGS